MDHRAIGLERMRQELNANNHHAENETTGVQAVVCVDVLKEIDLGFVGWIDEDLEFVIRNIWKDQVKAFGYEIQTDMIVTNETGF